MMFDTPLTRATLIRRYKRFLADVTLPDGQVVVAHCPNPGAMTGLDAPGSTVWLANVAGPGRKLGWRWVLASAGFGTEGAGGALVGVDTGLANRLAAGALASGLVPGLAGYDTINPEVVVAPGTRLDFRLDSPDQPPCLLEVKSVTLARGGWAEFPDSRTARGLRHLQVLAGLAEGGARAAMLYLVQRGDCARFRVAGDIDPAYAAAWTQARAAGVQMHALACDVSPGAITPARLVPVDPPCHKADAGLHPAARDAKPGQDSTR